MTTDIIDLQHIDIEGFEAKSHKELLEKFQLFIEEHHLHSIEVFSTHITFADGVWYGTMFYAAQHDENNEGEELEEETTEHKHTHDMHGATMINKSN